LGIVDRDGGDSPFSDIAREPALEKSAISTPARFANLRRDDAPQRARRLLARPLKGGTGQARDCEEQGDERENHQSREREHDLRSKPGRA
jgi:hypothetical protein